ncbi:hypothetical protein [Paenibacillus periandrae]|uniref:hypothetical protein n=1 Tax=Paenibacillus periandrae TaxID=1761741 RepID=UPI001F098B52|nr:hypothetical protein [Paenibacillus periandrae]
MSLQFRISQFEMDMELYIAFLLEHHDELNLPYSFAMKLSFIASPLVLGKALMIFNEEPYEMIGTAGFVYGTGAHDYEDQHICQVEVAFIQKAYRRTSVFAKGLKELVQAIKADNEAVQQVQFWTPVDQPELDRLLGRFTLLPHATKSIVNNMAFYTIPFDELESYCNRLRDFS